MIVEGMAKLTVYILFMWEATLSVNVPTPVLGGGGFDIPSTIGFPFR